MGLDLQQVLPQVEHLGRETARRAEAIAARLPAAERNLAEAASLDRDELHRRLAAARPPLNPAHPTDERLDQAFALANHPERLRIVAADGSQVHPNRHAAALFYVINVGSLELTHGSGQPPRAETQSRLYFEEEDLHDSRGFPVDTHLINARRDAAEMIRLAELAEADTSVATLAILDNGLLLWAASQEQKATRPDVERVLREYLGALDRLKASGAAVAGYISRPRGSHVVSLAEAAAETPPAAPSGLTDRLLFGRRLKPGQRSARFIHPVKLNETFGDRGHQVQFFYLHTGAQDGIARVEIPGWVAEDPVRLAAVHAGLVEQCRVTGIPYPLVRAHELALVGQDERRALDELVFAALARHGMSALPSQKAQTKQWTQRRRRHHL